MDGICWLFVVLIVCFFFFKQKTAYEMRISDCSSDVCSSDLAGAFGVGHHFEILGAQPAFEPPRRILPDAREERGQRQPDRRHRLPEGRGRSEEHTSELQSLMRISYAVFCLKKKKK